MIVYELTPYGREREPVVLALGAWGFKAMGEPREEQVITPESMTMDLRAADLSFTTGPGIRRLMATGGRVRA